MVKIDKKWVLYQKKHGQLDAIPDRRGGAAGHQPRRPFSHSFFPKRLSPALAEDCLF